ncbi:hypothetical protein YC2023_062436 [Brassica napus]
MGSGKSLQFGFWLPSKLSPSHASVVVLDVLIWHSNNQGSKAVKSTQLVLDFSELETGKSVGSEVKEWNFIVS